MGTYHRVEISGIDAFVVRSAHECAANLKIVVINRQEREVAIRDDLAGVGKAGSSEDSVQESGARCDPAIGAVIAENAGLLEGTLIPDGKRGHDLTISDSHQKVLSLESNPPPAGTKIANAVDGRELPSQSVAIQTGDNCGQKGVLARTDLEIARDFRFAANKVDSRIVHRPEIMVARQSSAATGDSAKRELVVGENHSRVQAGAAIS